MPIPDAEFSIDDALVRRLLGAQAPFLADLPVAHYFTGWDNEIFRLGDTLLVRLPRRAQSAPPLANEQLWLETLSAHLSLPVPSPVFTGEPGAGYPWPWSVVMRIDGVPLADTPRVDRDAAAAEELAHFYGSLHSPAPDDAPANPLRGVSLDQPAFDERVRRNLAAWAGPAADALAERWAAWSRAPEWDGPDLWLHGDPQPRNVVVDQGHLSGVVGWTEICGGDPAVDLAAAWLVFGAPARASFRAQAEWDRYDEHVWTRARAWALHLALVYALAGEPSPLAQIGEQALADLAEEPLD